jgi:hypothetical protein
MPQDSPQHAEHVLDAMRDRPLPNAADAVAAAAAAVQADAELLGVMLAELRQGWVWKLLMKQYR